MNLDLQIHADLDSLDKTVNKALAARESLQKAISDGSVSAAQATDALAALNRDIDSVAQMAMKSSEGSLLYETKLRDHLAYLAADIDLAYARPTAEQESVFQKLDQQAKDSEPKLEADTAQADKLVGSASKETRGSGQ